MCENVNCENNKNINKMWTPCKISTPPEFTEVQITYIGYNDGKPHSNGIAGWDGKQWYWSEDSDIPVDVDVIAWRHLIPPYIPLEE